MLKKTFIWFIAVSLVAVMIFVGHSSFRSHVSISKSNAWVISIFTGSNPFNLTSPPHIENPVLTARHVTDVKAEYVADPFIVRDSLWYMFFEVLNRSTCQGDIGYAKSVNGIEWEYCKIILDEQFHLSYPFVFMHDGQYYLIPESAGANELRLYKAIDFPEKWVFEKVLLKGAFGDHIVFEKDSLWWMFAGAHPTKHDALRLFYSDSIKGVWQEHPASPIIENNAKMARPGGRIVFYDGKMYRLGQNSAPTYGKQLNAFEIVDLTKTTYREKRTNALQVLKSGLFPWARRGMHHLDYITISKDSIVAAVDGYNKCFLISIEL